MEIEKILATKKRKAVYKLIIPTIGEFLVTALPKPTLEVPTGAVISAAGLVIFFDIWKLYFEDNIEEGTLKALLEEMGMMTLLGSIAAFLTAKLTNAVIGELGNLIPGIGWVIQGLVASIITLIAGFLWINFCEAVYIKKAQSASISI